VLEDRLRPGTAWIELFFFIGCAPEKLSAKK